MPAWRAVVFGAATTAAAASADLAAYPATVDVTVDSPPPAQSTPEQKLQELESLYKQGLITHSDYEAKKNQILQQIVQ